jgi:hypothetical protein
MMNWKFLALAGLTAVIAACGPGGGGNPATINSFTVDKPTIPSAQQVKLAWDVANADSLTLSANGATGETITPATTGTKDVNVAATTKFTLTAKRAGSADAVKELTVTVGTVSQIITISGTVVKWTGKPLQVNITVKDSSGTKTTTSNGQGKFTLANVSTPYEINAVPTAGSGIVPLGYARVTTATPTIVLRKDAFAADTAPGFQNECTPVPVDGRIKTTFSQAVGASNTGRLYYIAPGISYRPTESYAISPVLPAGTNNYTLSVPFDKDVCYDKLVGSVVYIERNQFGTIVAKGNEDNVNVRPNLDTLLDGSNASSPVLSIRNSNSADFRGTLTSFPSNTTVAKVNAYMRVEYETTRSQDGAKKLVQAYAPIVLDDLLDQNDITADYGFEGLQISNASPSFTLPIENFSDASKVQYRVGAFTRPDDKTNKLVWMWSDVLKGSGAAGINLALPSLSGTQRPSGDTKYLPIFQGPNAEVLPIFESAEVQSDTFTEGLGNIYYAGFVGGTQNWLGATSPVANKPIEYQLVPMNEPARNSLNQTYFNFALNSLDVREAAASKNDSADKVLDGRSIHRNMFTDAAATEPDLLRGGAWNIVPTAYKFEN